MILPTDHLLLALAVVVVAVVAGVAEMVEVVEVVVEAVEMAIQIRPLQASWTSRMWWTWRGCSDLAP